MKSRVRQISFLIFIIFCPVLFSAVLFAKEEFPTKPITLIVPYDAGGSTDQSSRALVNSMGKLAQPINIVNKPGAGGAVGYKVLQTSKPDGYTLVTTYTTIVTHKLLGNLPFNHHDLEMIIGFNYDAGALAVHGKSQWKTVNEFIDYSKKNKAKVSTAVPGGIWNIACQAIMRAYDTEFDLITSGGGTYQPAQELAGGHVDALVGNFAELVPFIKSGDIRVLAVTAPKRIEMFPDIPTFKELGFDKVTTIGFRAIAAPKGTPKAEQKVLHDAFQKAFDDPKYIEFMKSNAMIPVYMSMENTVKQYDDLEKAVETTLKK
jgi:tripartite-type tricarboxylate transporter receptor subunit TctC